MFYFAYGVTLNRKEMQKLAPEGVPVTSALLPNYRVAFVGWSRTVRGGVITIKPSQKDKVRGAVYDISEKDLARLDGAEGVPGTASRLKVRVFDEDGNIIESVTHVKTGNLEESSPAPAYAALIQQGYRDWGLV